MAFEFLTTPTLDSVPGPVANVALGSFNIVTLADPVNPQDADTLNARNNAIAALSQTNNSQILTGCGVVWTGNLNFTVAAGTYVINGTTYSVAQTNLTLSAADPSNPRFDVIALNTSNAAVVITGTPAANPLVPTVDPSTQLLDTIISVPAGATTPGNISNLVQYAEDAGAPTEWNASTNSAGTINLASTNNPHQGTKCIEATAAVAANYIQLQQGTGTVNLSNYNSLIFYIRSKAAWPSQKSITISFLNAGTQQGNALTFQNGSFGFVSSNTTSYQQIVIPLSNFNIGNSPVNQVKFLIAGGGSSIGFYMDDVSLQSGVVIGNQTFMVWKQGWNSTIAYLPNNVVVYNGIGYVCLVANTNSTPTATNTNWQAFGNPIRPIGFTLDGGGKTLVTGQVAGFQTSPMPGKITAWSIGVDAGTATVQTWKVATGTAVPASGNSISTAGVAISSNTYIKSSNVSDFTNTTVATDDIFAWNLSAVASATKLTFAAYITTM